MKTEKNDPVTTYKNGDGGSCVGLTKREYFAALAMQAVYQAVNNEAATIRVRDQCSLEGISIETFYAEMAVETADALIIALNKEKK
jgi:hypothetical protein